MLSLNLKTIFNARGIERPYTFLVNAGFTSHTAHILINSHTRNIKLDQLELLCKALVCEPSDLFLYSPSNNDQLAQDHPLLKLKQDVKPQNWKEKLATMPYKQLKEITEQINIDSNNI